VKTVNNQLSCHPPEIYFSDGLSYLEKSDIYSLGIIMITVLLSEEKAKQFEVNMKNVINEF